MSRPIFAAMAWNSDLGVVFEVSLLLARSRWDSASDLEDFEDIEDTAAWNSEVLFIGMIEGYIPLSASGRRTQRRECPRSIYVLIVRHSLVDSFDLCDFYNSEGRVGFIFDERNRNFCVNTEGTNVLHDGGREC